VLFLQAPLPPLSHSQQPPTERAARHVRVRGDAGDDGGGARGTQVRVLFGARLIVRHDLGLVAVVGRKGEERPAWAAT